jgi:hypothetical protein
MAVDVVALVLGLGVPISAVSGILTVVLLLDTINARMRSVWLCMSLASWSKPGRILCRSEFEVIATRIYCSWLGLSLLDIRVDALCLSHPWMRAIEQLLLCYLLLCYSKIGVFQGWW